MTSEFVENNFGKRSCCFSVIVIYNFCVTFYLRNSIHIYIKFPLLSAQHFKQCTKQKHSTVDVIICKVHCFLEAYGIFWMFVNSVCVCVCVCV